MKESRERVWKRDNRGIKERKFSSKLAEKKENCSRKGTRCILKLLKSTLRNLHTNLAQIQHIQDSEFFEKAGYLTEFLHFGDI